MWKPIDGYSDYQISDKGQVRSLKFKKIRVLKLQIGGRGYLHVGLWKNNERKIYKVHRLVLAAFIGSCPIGMETNHKNGNKLDNRIEKLEYVTKSENDLHAYQVGLRAPTEKAVHQFTLNGLFVAGYKSIRKAAIQTRLSQSNISKCCRGKSSYKTCGGFIWRFA